MSGESKRSATQTPTEILNHAEVIGNVTAALLDLNVTYYQNQATFTFESTNNAMSYIHKARRIVEERLELIRAAMPSHETTILQEGSGRAAGSSLLNGNTGLGSKADSDTSRVTGRKDGHSFTPPSIASTVLLPRELTAENGAKAALMGEFRADHDGGDYVSWDTIKKIHRRVVELFGTPGEGLAPSSTQGETRTVPVSATAAMQAAINTAAHRFRGAFSDSYGALIWESALKAAPVSATLPIDLMRDAATRLHRSDLVADKLVAQRLLAAADGGTHG